MNETVIHCICSKHKSQIRAKFITKSADLDLFVTLLFFELYVSIVQTDAKILVTQVYFFQINNCEILANI